MRFGASASFAKQHALISDFNRAISLCVLDVAHQLLSCSWQVAAKPVNCKTEVFGGDSSPANVSLSKCFQFGERQRQPICLYRWKSRVSHAVKILTKNNSRDRFSKINLSFFSCTTFLEERRKHFYQHFCVKFKKLPYLLKQWTLGAPAVFFPGQTHSRISSRVWTYVV